MHTALAMVLAITTLPVMEAFYPFPMPSASRIEIPRGSSIAVDGTLSPGEWADAKELQIEAGSDWPMRVLYKHDGSNLLFAFVGVTRTRNGKAEYRFPEVLLDPSNAKTATWIRGQWWLHASANECEGNGEFKVCRKDGKFMGAKEMPGWKANNHPYGSPPVVEIEVSFDKASLQVDPRRIIGLAISLTNTSDAWHFWPSQAKLENPSTWGEAVILP